MQRLTFTLMNCAALGSFLLLPPLSAQDVEVETPATQVEVDANRGEVEVRNRSAAARDRSHSDQHMNGEIADWLMVDQQFTLQIAEYGMQRTNSDEVKQFLETLMQDHQALSEQLTSMTFTSPADTSRDRVRSNDPELRDDRRQLRREERRARREGAIEKTADTVGEGIDLILEGAEEIANSDEPVRRDRDDRINAELRDRELRDSDRGTERRQVAVTKSAWVGIHKEITDKKVAHYRKDLESREGYEFDAALIGMLVGSHLEQEATLATLHNHATGDLQKLIADSSETVMDHRKRAEQLMDDIKPGQR